MTKRKDETPKEELNIADGLGEATEIAFSFDTTGSMQPCIADVRAKVEETCQALFGDIKGLKIGLIAHGDYCDGDQCITMLPLTDDQQQVMKFVRDAPNTSGGDAPECYELVIKTARLLGWSDTVGVGRALVMIGDDQPHPPEYSQNKENLSWTEELGQLLRMGVKVYPLQCMYQSYRQAPNQFWEDVAQISQTKLLKLAEFDESTDTISAVAYAASGSEAWDKYHGRMEKKMADGKPISDALISTMTAMKAEAEGYDDIRAKRDDPFGTAKARKEAQTQANKKTKKTKKTKIKKKLKKKSK